MIENILVRDPTSEAAPTQRLPVAAPKSLDGATIALLDITKFQSKVFLDFLDARLTEQGLKIKRYRKASNSKPAVPEIIQAIAKEADIVVEALAD